MDRLKKVLPFVFVISLAATACNEPNATRLPDTALEDPVNPTPTGVPNPVPTSAPPAYTTQVLIYNGTGVSTSDWQNTEKIVKSQGWSYQLANAAQLNAMTLEELTRFGMIVVPGGSGGTITSNLMTDTRLRVRHAVREYGLGYVGFCAGAWVAVGPEAETTKLASYGLAVAKGSVLNLFLPGGKAPTAAMVDVTFADGSTRDLVWWGGPYTPEWKDGVVARYDTGQPAISQTFAGKGFVVISGPHPEAPSGWRSTAGTDSDGLDYDIAIDMIDAALHKKPLPAF